MSLVEEYYEELIIERDQEIQRLRKAVGEQTEAVRKKQNEIRRQVRRANKAEKELQEVRNGVRDRSEVGQYSTN